MSGPLPPARRSNAPHPMKRMVTRIGSRGRCMLRSSAHRWLFRSPKSHLGLRNMARALDIKKLKRQENSCSMRRRGAQRPTALAAISRSSQTRTPARTVPVRHGLFLSAVRGFLRGIVAAPTCFTQHTAKTVPSIAGSWNFSGSAGSARLSTRCRESYRRGVTSQGCSTRELTASLESTQVRHLTEQACTGFVASARATGPRTLAYDCADFARQHMA